VSHNAYWDAVRESVIGKDLVIETCFGARRLLYADFTASGRAVGIVEDAINGCLACYANTHTEDDETGRTTTERLHQAEKLIKRLLNAGDDYAVIAVGAGTTGAVERLQQILGVYEPPATRDRKRRDLAAAFGTARADEIHARLRELGPVVFVGPYEHHSNELSWRESAGEVVEIELDGRGLLDLDDLERKVSDPRYASRQRIGAFSAGSNVSGVTTPAHDVARILHRHGCLAVFDFAAVAPYRRIDVNRDRESYFDAVYFSPHKFLGGPGSAGLLIFRREIYRRDLPPTFAGGGTVEFVNWDSQDYTQDIETREKAGTPGILQTLRAALALELKSKLGEQAIEEREAQLIRQAIGRLAGIPQIAIVGNAEPDNRIAILSFVVKAGDSYLHPRFVTQLLNDLFGIQSRAGCLCAGPYGHRLLHIDRARSEQFRRVIHEGKAGLKPGWTRVNFHFLMTDAEVRFLCDSIELVARKGMFFLPLYEFDIAGGGWRHRDWRPRPVEFNLQAQAGRPPAAEPPRDALAEAARVAAGLEKTFDAGTLKTTERDLVPFVYVHST
jgi:selenocysteine lyase/cysteine desulfurase